MKYTYRTKGTCSSYIELEMEGNVLKDVNFVGGCNGNLKGICALTKGMTYEEIKEKLGGIKCGFKNTSCPDQLVQAMTEVMEGNI
ncbi:MAG: TIGR03905 family TSCPD domain-containing protein [Clostridia bacterium]|nr:TIGR03905 family TSCPD domain-containing protein [Clostridia bacterium]